MVLDDRPGDVPEDDRPWEGSWDIPTVDGVDQLRVCQGELYVLDWVLSTGSQLLLGMALDEVMVWKDLRLAVWKAILDPEHEENELGVMLPLSHEDAETLLAAVPTQMTWGDGIDYGQMLKRKIASFLLGTYEDEMVLVERLRVEKEKNSVRESLQKRVEETKTALDTARRKVEETKANIERKRSEVVNSVAQAESATRQAELDAKQAEEDFEVAQIAADAAKKEVDDYGGSD